MLSTLSRRIPSLLSRTIPSRSYSELATEASSSLSSIPTSPPTKKNTRPYFVPRNTRGNLPVYTDVRNAGGRHLVLVRNIEGNISALAEDLSQSLFAKDTHEASKMKIQLAQSKHLVISGGRWKNHVAAWLKERGF